MLTSQVFGFYLLIGVLLSPTILYLESTLRPDIHHSNKLWVLAISTIMEYLLWPISISYYTILIVKLHIGGKL